MVRIGHISDLHFTLRPSFSELLYLKRVFGFTNQLLFRRSSFILSFQRSLIRKILSLNLDALLISGDLTSMALESEFGLARKELEPLVEKCPVFVVPGNHDVYVSGSLALMRQYFGDLMKGNALDGDERLPVFTIGSASFIGMNPCEPRVFDSGGMYSYEQVSIFCYV